MASMLQQPQYSKLAVRLACFALLLIVATCLHGCTEKCPEGGVPITNGKVVFKCKEVDCNVEKTICDKGYGIGVKPGDEKKSMNFLINKADECVIKFTTAPDLCHKCDADGVECVETDVQMSGQMQVHTVVLSFGGKTEPSDSSEATKVDEAPGAAPDGTKESSEPVSDATQNQPSKSALLDVSVWGLHQASSLLNVSSLGLHEKVRVRNESCKTGASTARSLGVSKVWHPSRGPRHFDKEKLASLLKIHDDDTIKTARREDGDMSSSGNALGPSPSPSPAHTYLHYSPSPR